MKRNDFNKFRFDGMNFKVHTIKYVTMDRVNADATKLCVKVDPTLVFKTKYGYGVHLNEKHVLFLKDWQVDMNIYGCEILLNKEFFTPKEFGFDRRYSGEKWDKLLKWDTWVRIATIQDSKIDEDGVKLNEVKWMISKKGIL